MQGHCGLHQDAFWLISMKQSTVCLSRRYFYWLPRLWQMFVKHDHADVSVLTEENTSVVYETVLPKLNCWSRASSAPARKHELWCCVKTHHFCPNRIADIWFLCEKMWWMFVQTCSRSNILQINFQFNITLMSWLSILPWRFQENVSYFRRWLVQTRITISTKNIPLTAGPAMFCCCFF